MEINFDKLVASLSKSPSSTDVIYQLTSLIERQSTQLLSSFVSQSFQSLLTLQQWAWQLFSEDSLQWINQPYYIQLFHTLASFNKILIFTHEKIEDDIKASLLIPETIDQLNKIFKHIEQTNDDNDPYITIINLWFDNHSYFLHDHLQYSTLCVFDHIGQYFVRNYIMNKQFKYYLTQLQQPQITESMFTSKMLFYIKTCSFYLYIYLGVKPNDFYYTPEEIVRYLGDDYLEIIRIHIHTVVTWNNYLLTSIAHLIAFLCRCCWWGEQITTQMKILFPKEEITYECIQNLMQIIADVPHYEYVKNQRSNDETILLEASILFLKNIIQTQNISWLFRSNTSYQKILLTIAETVPNYIICLATYSIMSIVLTDEQMKELKITDRAVRYSFNMLEQAWYRPSKMYKQVPIYFILQGIRNLSKNDSMQQKIADLNKIPLFIEMFDEYPIVHDIFWALSFNQDIQQELRSNSTFMSKLSHLAKEADNEQMRKIIHGILWNLEINHENQPTTEFDNKKSFDIMISYSHKDKTLSKQLYDELSRAGYRVWIDFDQMHGNVMDAMAQAIECSQTVIICMSEDYQKSNYCRAEAHYAFQRERKIVPVLLQKHYKPDGWLLFLVGQLKYIDFIKYEFNRAMEMLFKELKSTHIVETNAVVLELKKIPTNTLPKLCLPTLLPKNILDWTQKHVQEWLVAHNLHQMACFLADCNGRSLLYLDEYIRNGNTNQMLNLLQEDSFRKIGQTLSLVELACFRSLMDEQKQFMESNISSQLIKSNNKKSSFIFCRMM